MVLCIKIGFIIIDGTQFEGKKKLGITTIDAVEVGDMVIFKGTILLNKDFGHGCVSLIYC